MTDQEMDRMNDYLLEQSLIMNERQQERDYDAMVDEELARLKKLDYHIYSIEESK